MTSLHKKIWLNLKFKPALAVITAFIIIILIASPFFYHLYWSQKDVPAINAIPNDAAVILKINDIPQTWPLITTSQIWKNFTREPAYANLEPNINHFFKLAHLNSGFTSAINRFPLYLSLHPLHEGGAGILFTLQTGHAVRDHDINPLIQQFFGPKVQIVIRDFAGVNIRKIILPKSTTGTDKPPVINLVLLQGILIASTNTTLVNEAILMLQSGSSIVTQPGFKQVSRTESPKANAVLYINYHNFPNLLNNQLDVKSISNIAGISNFCDWTELDINIKEKEILMNGFSSAVNTSHTYLNLFVDQPTPPSSVDSLLPGNTASFINVGFKDYKTIFRRLKLQLKMQSKLDQFESKLKAISDSFNINAEQTLTGWVQNEMGVAITNNLSLSEEENVYAYFKTSSPGQAEASLSILAKRNSMLFNGITIHAIEYPSLLPLIYGRLFPDAQKYYFAVAGNYVVFARSVNAITAFLSSYTSKNTLSSTTAFQNFKNCVSGTSNIWIYSDLSQIIRHISTLLIQGDKQKYPVMHALRTAKLISAEFTLINKLFYTSICIANDTTNTLNPNALTEESYSSQPTPEWSSYVGVVRSGPIVAKTDKGSLAFLIDENNKLWCFNETGGILWSHITAGHILGDLRIIDYKGKKCIAFNSSELLYVLNLNGEYEDGFPLKLPFNATNGFCYLPTSKEGPQFFIATSKNSIQAITASGKKPSQWSNVEMKVRVVKPAEIIERSGRKLLAFVDEAGRIKIADLNGTVSGSFENVPALSTNTQLWPNRISGKADVICAAADGDLLFIKKDGTFEKVPFETVITNPFFLVDQFDNSGRPNYIFLDQARMTVFNQQREIIYEYNLASFPRFQPVVFSLPDYRKFYLVTAGNSRLMLFNSQGILREFPSISSESLPAVIPIEGSRSILVLTVEKQILNAYKYTF